MTWIRTSCFGLLLVALGACGGPSPEAKSPASCVRDGSGKPVPPIGRVELVVVDRPSHDRVVLEARWMRGERGWGREVELVLPEGAWLVEGQSSKALAPERAEGVLRWTVGFRTGEPLDAVVRLRARAGHGPCAREASVRLASGDDD